MKQSNITSCIKKFEELYNVKQVPKAIISDTIKCKHVTQKTLFSSIYSAMQF